MERSITMNFDLFDNMDGMVLRERESMLRQPPMNSGNNGSTNKFPANTPLAMAYVPYQQWGEVYTEDEALSHGTLFPELNFPFSGGGMNE